MKLLCGDQKEVIASAAENVCKIQVLAQKCVSQQQNDKFTYIVRIEVIKCFN